MIIVTDLMVGDLVVVNKDGLCIKKNTIVEVRGIEADQRLELDDRYLIGSAHCNPLDKEQFPCGIWCEYLDPIPLTAEILEKNGFLYKKLKGIGGDSEIWGLADDYFDIDIYEWSDSIWVFRYDCCEMSLPHMQVTMSYVHELQRALRDCGLSEIANNIIV